MRRIPITLALIAAGSLGLARASAAAEPMTAAEFDAFATGKTLTYGLQGDVWGTEQYLSGRRVIWAFAGEDCKRGTWHEEAGNICFVYEDRPEAQCWRFFRDDGSLHAQFAGDPESAPLSVVIQSSDPMPCPGPEVGV